MSYTPVEANRQFGQDAGGRTRSSIITTLFDGKTLGADDTNIWETLGTGTATFSVNKTTLSVTSGQYQIKSGKHTTPYFSGKSHLIEVTFDGFNAEANVTKRAGYFSSNAVAPYDSNLDGFWIQNDGTTIRLKIQRNGTSILDLPWTSWDNYNAISSYNWSNFTVALFDFLWLGGTAVRLFIKTDAGFVLAHTFKWAGNNTDTFIQSPNNVVRYQIRSSTGSGSMRAICSQVATEGSIQQTGKKLTVYNASAITTNSIGTIYALKGIKKNTTTYRDTAVAVTDVSVCNTGTADAGIVMVILNPTLSAPLTYTNNSRISEGTATTQTITAGTGRVLYATPSGIQGQISGLADNFLSNVGMLLNGTSDQIVLAYIPTTANQSVFGTLTVKQF